MKALVKYARGVGNVRIQEMPVPTLQEENWVLIKVHAAGVCGTDIHVWQDKFRSWPPVILGHEFSGEVVQTGSEVKKFHVGDRVVAEPNLGGCGVCRYCRSGNLHMCPEKLTFGWRVHGSMGEYVAMPEYLLHHIPDGVGYTLAALCEPLAIVVYAVAERGRIEIGDTVLVQGCGPIGILSVYMAKMLGAGQVIVTGVDKSMEYRLPLARAMGADILVNVQQEDLAQKIEKLTGGAGVDVVIESSGVPDVITQSAFFLRKMGRMIALGIPEGSVNFPWNHALLKNIDVYFNMSSSYTAWDKALDRLAKGGASLERLITSVRLLEQWEESFNLLLEEKEIKVVFDLE